MIFVLGNKYHYNLGNFCLNKPLLSTNLIFMKKGLFKGVFSLFWPLIVDE